MTSASSSSTKMKVMVNLATLTTRSVPSQHAKKVAEKLKNWLDEQRPRSTGGARASRSNFAGPLAHRLGPPDKAHIGFYKLGILFAIRVGLQDSRSTPLCWSDDGGTSCGGRAKSGRPEVCSLIRRSKVDLHLFLRDAQNARRKTRSESSSICRFKQRWRLIRDRARLSIRRGYPGP